MYYVLCYIYYILCTYTLWIVGFQFFATVSRQFPGLLLYEYIQYMPGFIDQRETNGMPLLIARINELTFISSLLCYLIE
jgi:hypothetical protein